MRHYYDEIPGWFTFPKLYSEMVARFDNANFLEIGSWKGRSAIYIAVEIINLNKNIKLYCIDTWEGSREHNLDESVVNKTLYEEFLQNTLPVKNVINGIKASSIKISKVFCEEFFDFIFIDASHDYEDVKNDLVAWYPKVKKGGVFAGHDYQPYWDEVQMAVDEFATKNNLTIKTQEECWIIEKK